MEEISGGADQQHEEHRADDRRAGQPVGQSTTIKRVAEKCAHEMNQSQHRNRLAFLGDWLGSSMAGPMDNARDDEREGPNDKNPSFRSELIP